MINLRKYLGAHEGLRPGQLTEREVAMLIVCAGRQAGFTVKTEISVPTTNQCGKSVRGEIDVGWLKGNKLVAVWEIDGQDAPAKHFLGDEKKGTAGNKAKFLASGALYKIQVLYSLKNNLESKRMSRREKIEQDLNDIAILATDEELMNTKGIEDLATRIQTEL